MLWCVHASVTSGFTPCEVWRIHFLYVFKLESVHTLGDMCILYVYFVRMLNLILQSVRSETACASG